MDFYITKTRKLYVERNTDIRILIFISTKPFANSIVDTVITDCGKHEALWRARSAVKEIFGDVIEIKKGDEGWFDDEAIVAAYKMDAY